MSRGRGLHRNSKYWTKERVINGLIQFRKDFGFCPTSTEKYQQYQQFTGVDHQGRKSNLGWHQKYPSSNSVLDVFPTFRKAWTAAGFGHEIDTGYEPWSETEDWFIVESAGILPRTEVAEILKRTVPAIKRRLYDMGQLRVRDRWGFSLTKAGELLGLNDSHLRKYINHGVLPIFRGYKCIYINPADIFVIEEADWPNVVFEPDIEQRIKAALIQRACRIIKYGADWRKHEIYKFAPKQGYTRKQQTPRLLNTLIPDRPNDLEVGDWVKIHTANAMSAAGRIGRILNIYYSPAICSRRDGTYRSAWIAHVEFPRLRNSVHSNDNRIRYSLPLDCFERTDAPVIEPKPLSMHPEAIRGRKRFTRAQKRATDRFQEIKQSIT